MSDLVSGRRRCRILLVEDDSNLAFLLRYNLEARGFWVAWISDGLSVLGNLRADPPDLVVLDWGLPGLSGIEILRRMRSCAELRRIPVLMLTARYLAEERQRALATGANVFLAKPFSISDVIAAVHALEALSVPAATAQLEGIPS